MKDYKSIKPAYSDSNPKLDFYLNGEYKSSSNWYKNIKHAEAHKPQYTIVRSAK